MIKYIFKFKFDCLVSILESSTTAKEALNYEVEFIFDTNKQDGAPIKVLGNKKFRKFFPDFKFTEVSEGIQHTINYYKKHLG